VIGINAIKKLVIKNVHDPKVKPKQEEDATIFKQQDIRNNICQISN